MRSLLWLALLYKAPWLARATLVLDTTAPILSIVDVQPFIYHFLITVELDENGTVYCGSLPYEASYTPSVFQLKTGTDLHGHGWSSVSAASYTGVVVYPQLPAHGYDTYCYAEDETLNGIGLTDIAATRQSLIFTASGGDYTPPTITYVAPFVDITRTAFTVHVQMSEDGTAWCVALEDGGSGTVAPSAAMVVNNVNVDSWATSAVRAVDEYKARLDLRGLQEDVVYDIYCFAEDMSGNGIDGTPAWVPNPDAIPSTIMAGIRTLVSRRASSFLLHNASGSFDMDVEPATWNLDLPRGEGDGHGKCQDLESRHAPMTLPNAYLTNFAALPRASCASMQAAPRGGRWLALVRRGGCSFAEKARRAHRAGYGGILVVNHQVADRLLDMTANADDDMIPVPGWLIGASDGFEIIHADTTSVSGPLSVYISDHRRKPKLANFQSDLFGTRIYASI